MVSYQHLPEIFYLGVYQPKTGECEGDFDFDFKEYSSKIWALKERTSSVIEAFADCILSNLCNDFDCIVVVPPHHIGKNDSGIKILAQKIASKSTVIDATSCLIRHKPIDRLSRGNRSLENHLQSIKVVNQEIIKNNKLLLIDDVSTTGTSLKACQILLKSAEAKIVKSFALGKTIKKAKDLELFYSQYDKIMKLIGEEFINLLQELEYKLSQEMKQMESEYRSKKNCLSEENFDDWEFYFHCIFYKIRENHNLSIGSIFNIADWHTQSLNNLYGFSFEN